MTTSINFNNNNNSNNNREGAYTFAGNFTLDGKSRRGIYQCSEEELIRDYTVPELEYFSDLYGDCYLDEVIPKAREARRKEYGL